MPPINIAADNYPALIVGAALFCIATVMALKQWWAHRQLMRNPKVDEAGYVHTERQIQRRLAISGILFVVSVLIPLGDLFGVIFLNRPLFFFAFWMGVLLLVMAMVLVAMVDLVATVAFARSSRAQLSLERKAIEEDIRQYRARRQASAAQNPEKN